MGTYVLENSASNRLYISISSLITPLNAPLYQISRPPLKSMLGQFSRVEATLGPLLTPELSAIQPSHLPVRPLRYTTLARALARGVTRAPEARKTRASLSDRPGWPELPECPAESGPSRLGGRGRKVRCIFVGARVAYITGLYRGRWAEIPSRGGWPICSTNYGYSRLIV